MAWIKKFLLKEKYAQWFLVALLAHQTPTLMCGNISSWIKGGLDQCSCVWSSILRDVDHDSTVL
jgi:hypothetical protein